MNEKKTAGFIEKIAAFIVDKRNLFFLLYIFAFIFCLFSMNWVQVENDVTTYLPEDTETRQGIVAMNENFVTFGTAQVMVSNITYETAEEIYDTIAAIEGVDMVTFGNDADHYTKAWPFLTLASQVATLMISACRLWQRSKKSSLCTMCLYTLR